MSNAAAPRVLVAAALALVLKPWPISSVETEPDIRRIRKLLAEIDARDAPHMTNIIRACHAVVEAGLVPGGLDREYALQRLRVALQSYCSNLASQGMVQSRGRGR